MGSTSTIEKFGVAWPDELSVFQNHSSPHPGTRFNLLLGCVNKPPSNCYQDDFLTRKYHSQSNRTCFSV